MDAALKAKWVEALRSGNYEQSTGALCRGEKYCCLGVLVEVGKLATKNNVHFDGVVEYLFTDGSTSAGSIPDVVGDKIRLSSGRADALINMNDYEKKSFAEIANWIEVTL